jgi:hypothetical protein
MKKIVRLTESDLVNLVKKVLNEQKLLTEEKHYDYTQKGGHFLIGNDGKGISLPVGTVWDHQGFGAEQADWLELKKYNIIFHCGDVDYIVGQQGGKNLKNFKNSGPLIQQLKKEYCLGNEWNNSSTSKHPGLFIQGSWDRQGGRY